jgi:hypothetical protein
VRNSKIGKWSKSLTLKKRGKINISPGFFYFRWGWGDVDVVIEWRLRRWGPLGSHTNELLSVCVLYACVLQSKSVCKARKLPSLEPPFDGNLFFFVWMRPLLFGQWRYYTQKIGRSLSRSLWKSIESTLSLSCDSYVYNILFNLHHTHTERERVNECGYCYSIPFCGEGGGRASKKETNLMFIFITAGQKRNIYSTQIEKVFFSIFQWTITTTSWQKS